MRPRALRGKRLRHDLNLESDVRLALVEEASELNGHASLNETLRALIDRGLRDCLSQERIAEVTARVVAARAEHAPVDKQAGLGIGGEAPVTRT